MASNRPLPGDLTVTGMDQASLYAWMANVTDLLNEIQTDHATTKTTVDALITLTTELRADHATAITFAAELKTDVDAAVADLTAIRGGVLAVTAKLDADGGVTDTNYAATCNPAALTATTIAATNVATITAAVAAAGPAALSNSTAITLLRA